MDNTQPLPPYMDTNLPVEVRSDDLISRMTLAEKVSQLMVDSAPVDRLGIPAYHWWNEALHGVARAGTATVFPRRSGSQPPGMKRWFSGWQTWSPTKHA